MFQSNYFIAEGSKKFEKQNSSQVRFQKVDSCRSGGGAAKTQSCPARWIMESLTVMVPEFHRKFLNDIESDESSKEYRRCVQSFDEIMTLFMEKLQTLDSVLCP